MPDVTDGFADLAERYPGSRQRIEGGVERRQAKAKKRAEEDAAEVDRENTAAWVDNPYFKREMRINGENMTFYLLAALAEALLRKPGTIRAWEADGKFPQTPFRTPSNGALGGKRLYTREMIEGVAAIADDEGLLYSQRPLTPRFTQRVTDLFTKTRQEIRKR
jgi:hypothetical protein